MRVAARGFSYYTALFLREGSSVPPCARHNKVREGLAGPWREFALLQLVGQRLGVTRVADRHRGDRLPVVGDMEYLARLVGIETGHLVDIEAIGHRLETKLALALPTS